MGRVHVVHGSVLSVGQTLSASGVTETPKAALVVACKATSLDTVTADTLEYSIGLFDGTRRRGISMYSEDAQTTTDTKKITFDDKTIKWPSASGSSVEFRASAELVAGGIQLTWDAETNSGWRVWALLFFGSDVSTYVGSVDAQAVGTTLDVTAPNFEPDCLLILGPTINFGSDETYQNNNTPGIAFCVNDGSETIRTMRWRDRHNVTTTQAEMRLSEAWAVQQIGTSRETTIDAFLSTGFTVGFNGSSGNANGLAYLAVKGIQAAIADARSTTTFAIEPGFKPGGILTLCTQITGGSGWENTSDTTDATAGPWTIGASTEFGEEAALLLHSRDGQSTSDVYSAIYDDSSIICLETGTTPAIDYEGDVTFDADSVDVSMSNAGTDDRITMLVFETDSVTGTAALTLPKAQEAASGLETFTGTSATSLTAIDLDAVGLETFTGTSAAQMQAVDADAVGLETFTGTSAIDLPAIKADAVGVETFAGTSAAPMPAADLDAVGVEVFTGTSAALLAAIDSDAVGLETFTGTSAMDLPSVEAAAVGDVANPVTGTSDVTLQAIAGEAAGLETFAGTSAADLSAVEADAVGLEEFTGTSSADVAAVGADAVGIEEFTGTAAVDLPAVDLDAVGGTGFFGTSATDLPSVEADAVGLEEFTGTAAADMPSVEADASGEVVSPITGTSATDLPSVDADAVGLETFAGSSATDLPAIDLDAVGVLGFTGAGVVVVPPIDADAAGLEIFTGTSAVDLPAIDADAAGEVTGTIAGVADVVLPAIDLDAVGLEEFTGTGAIILPAITSTAAGLVIETITGASVLVLPAVEVAADDEPHVFGCSYHAASYDGATALAASYDAETPLGGSYDAETELGGSYC